MIADILEGVNSTSIAIRAFVQKFPTLTHPNSVVFTQAPLSRDALKGKLGDDRVPGVITGLGFESMTPFEATGADWVNLREYSSNIIERSGSEPVGTVNGRQPLYDYKATTTALVVDPADIRAAIKKGVVATIPVWEVEYVCPGRSTIPGVATSLPPVRLSGVPARLGRDHSFVISPRANNVRDTYTMTTTKRAAAVTATYRPFSEL